MINPRMTLLKFFLFQGALLFAVIHVGVFVITRSITLPPHRVADEVVFQEEQNWTADERQWFYHETQGGALELIIPYKWLMALEQPRIPFSIVGRVEKFMHVNYISRFGFLPDPLKSYNPDNTQKIKWAEFLDHPPTPDEPGNNPDQLPVGFVRTSDYLDYQDLAEDGEPRVKDVVGFTCAACHTGQVNYEDDAGKYWGFRVEGGPAMTNLTKFKTAIGISIALTTYLPQRFDRFADEVGGDRHELKDQLKKLIKKGKALKEEADKVYTTVDGFGRLDALGRIGNFVFAQEINPKNWYIGNAPVNFPPIWDTPWFDWAQYNASIKQPMVRNAGEAMGVFARVNFTAYDDPDKLFKSTARFDNLYEIESLLRGKKPFDGLRSPKWPSNVFGAPDRAAVARGRALYIENCRGCHLPAPEEDSGFYDFNDRTVWTEPDEVHGLQYLNLRLINLYEIGTDPLTAVNFAQRIVELGPIGEMFKYSSAVAGVATMGDALPFVVEKVKNKRYDELGLTRKQREEWNGYRPNDTRAPLAYKARPHNGIWATAPYLHNGSVPTLMQLLGPYEERDKTFWVGTKDYDPVNVGFVTGKVKGAFKFDTSLPGNSNFGHLFNGDFDHSASDWEQKMDWSVVPSGTIGRKLEVQERKDIIEFLKTL